MAGFVTYAQNFEDVMLWRALHGVGTGFYIDVGAADPEEDSVTRAFYDHGWRGVNIEPSPDHFRCLAPPPAPRDISLCCLVGAAPGGVRRFTIFPADARPQHGRAGNRRPPRRRWPPGGGRQRADADIGRHLPRVRTPPDIHFLKIDVEERRVRMCCAARIFATYRPWIVVAEATEPMSQVENWQAWDLMLAGADYQFVWFDGLNRFYLATERADTDLRHAFRTPPNVFDGWIRPRGPQQMAILNRARAVQDAMDNLREETARVRATFDAEAAAARGEAHAGRAEASAARAEASAAQQEASAARTEAAALRVALAAVQHQADTVRVALGAARQEADTARDEAGTLRTALGAARHEAGVARAEGRCAAVGRRRRPGHCR